MLWVAIVRVSVPPWLQRGQADGFDLTALGSMTGPAALQGVFGNRVSTGVLHLDGVMPITKSAPPSQLGVPGHLLTADCDHLDP